MCPGKLWMVLWENCSPNPCTRKREVFPDCSYGFIFLECSFKFQNSGGWLWIHSRWCDRPTKLYVVVLLNSQWWWVEMRIRCVLFPVIKWHLWWYLGFVLPDWHPEPLYVIGWFSVGRSIVVSDFGLLSLVERCSASDITGVGGAMPVEVVTEKIVLNAGDICLTSRQAKYYNPLVDRCNVKCVRVKGMK